MPRAYVRPTVGIKAPSLGETPAAVLPRTGGVRGLQRAERDDILPRPFPRWEEAWEATPGARHVRGKRGRVAWRHSITASANATKVCGTSTPRSFAVLRLMTNSNWFGCSIGRSPGFAPLRILSTKVAARRRKSAKLSP